MTIDEYWRILKDARGIVPMSPMQDGNRLCSCPNQTQYEIPDPEYLPEDARESILKTVLENIGSLVSPS